MKVIGKNTPLAALVALVALVAIRWGFLAAMGVFVGVTVLSIPVCFLLAELTRRRELAALTARRGWTYRRDHHPGLAARLPSFLLPPSRASRSRFRDMVAGEAGGRPFLSFSRSYSYSITEGGVYGEGETPKSVFHWIVLVEGLPASLPAISCRRRRPFDHGPDFRAGESDGFQTGDPAFDKSFCLEGPASLLAQGLADRIRALMPELAASVGGDFSWQAADGVLATWRYDGVYTDPQLLEPLLAALAALADAITLAAHGQLR